MQGSPPSTWTRKSAKSARDAPEPQPAHVEYAGVTINASKDTAIGARRLAAVDNALIEATKFGERFGQLAPTA